MKQNKFDIVMDYIDANILQDVETIKKGIYTLIGYNSLTFGKCFSVPQQNLHQIVVHHNTIANSNRDFGQRNTDSADEFYVSHQQVMDQSDPDLSHDRIF